MQLVLYKKRQRVWKKETRERKKNREKNGRRLININARVTLPFTLPPLLLEAFMDRLSNRWFHKVNVAYNERCKNGLQLVMEAPVLQIICKWNLWLKFFGKHLRSKVYHPFGDNRWEPETGETNPTYPEAVQLKHAPCRTQTSTKTSPRVPPANHWTMRMPTKKGKFRGKKTKKGKFF